MQQHNAPPLNTLSVDDSDRLWTLSQCPIPAAAVLPVVRSLSTQIMIKLKNVNGDAFRVPASASDTVGELERWLLIARPDLFGNNRDMQIVFDSADPPYRARSRV